MKRITAALALLATTAQASPPPERNILTWPMPDTVSPEGRAVASAMAAAPSPNPLPPIADQRRLIDGLQQTMAAQLLTRYRVTVTAATIAGVPVRIVLPSRMTALGKGPVLLNLHGGGFQLDSGSLTETIPIAARTGLPVVSVLYRLAPEHPYPAALDDALAVYRALLSDRGAKGIAVYGTSAGAVLSAELMAKLGSLRVPMPAALGFFSGSGDLARGGDSATWASLPTGGTSITDAMAPYVGRTSPTDPILSPLYGDLSRFPPTLLVSSTRDALLSGTSIFGRALLEQGVDARLVVFDGLPHAFWAYMAIPETDQANALMAKFLAGRLAPASVPPRR